MAHRFREDYDESLDPLLPVEEPNKAQLFVGNIYDLDDKKVWGFGEEGQRHPGVCYGVQIELGSSQVLKGTSQLPEYHVAYKYCRIDPCPHNGLELTTWFRLEPRVLRLRKLEIMHHDRLIGRLSPEDLEKLQTALREFSCTGRQA